MASPTYKQLIDVAIGSPEPGHVNFFALHYLLFSFADKFGILDEVVNGSKYCDTAMFLAKKSRRKMQYIFDGEFWMRRMAGGEDPEDEAVEKKTSEQDLEKPPDVEQEIVTEEQDEESKDTAEEAALTAPVEELEAVLEEVHELPEAVSIKSVTEVKSKESKEESKEPQLSPKVSKKMSQPSVSGSQKQSQEKLDTGTVSTLSTVTGSKGSYFEAQIKAPQSLDLLKGTSIMKDQLQLVMEELRILTNIAINKKAEPITLNKLRIIASRLRLIEKDNIYIEGRLRSEEEISISTAEQSLEEMMLEHIVESEMEMSLKMSEESPHIGPERESITDLCPHLTYSPVKMLDQIMELKSDICTLTDKINSISAAIIEQDSRRTTMLLQQLQTQLIELRNTTSHLSVTVEDLEKNQENHLDTIDEINKTLDNLAEDKVDKSDMEILLADKVTFSQLQRKVSHEQYQELQCRVEKQFGELNKLIGINEKNMLGCIENVRSTSGTTVIHDILSKFKDNIDKEIKSLQDILNHYINLTNDECAAAGARVQVMQDLACISCDTTCVMRTIEKGKVAKLPNAHATTFISPLVTYELGSLRKSGVMGYYRKDEFPHTPDAWMRRQNVNMKECKPRHAGGEHTKITNKDNIEKVLRARKK